MVLYWYLVLGVKLGTALVRWYLEAQLGTVLGTWWLILILVLETVLVLGTVLVLVTVNLTWYCIGTWN